MTAEFWLGVSVGAFVVIAFLLIAAFASSAGKRSARRHEAKVRHPSMYDAGPHFKVGPAIDLPLGPKDGIPPIRP